MRYLLLIILSFGSLQGMTRASAPPAVVAENTGVRTLKFEDASRNRPVVVELWYPTTKSEPIAELDPSDLVYIHPVEIRNAPIAESPKKYPLIIISHGHGGDRRSLSWLADSLVQNGFIVAAVEHHGNSWRTYNPLVSLRFWERARDISFAINQLLKEPGLKTQIDSSRIGFVGYSLGGMTGLSLGGAKAENVKEIVQQQQRHFKEIEPELVDKIDFSDAHASFAEPRIKAMVLLSPATFVFPSNAFKNVKIPVALFASEGDEVLPFKDHALRVVNHLIPAKYKIYGNKISHHVFVNPVSETGKQVISESARKDSDADRNEIHNEVARSAADFFKQNLK